MAAAVEAAPIRREWEDMLAAPLEMSRRMLFKSDLVRYVPFWKVNNGPVLEWW